MIYYGNLCYYFTVSVRGGLEKPMNNSIEFKQFDFRLTAKEPLILPAYKGSTFRDGFGYAFKRVLCAIKDKECSLLILVGYFADAVRIDFSFGNPQRQENPDVNGR